jgi:G3E family GTPase
MQSGTGENSAADLNVDVPGERVPLTLLTGFLGAGKTTVLNRILTGGHARRIAVLVNDFGALDIADELIAERDGETLRLTNGCICCSLKEDLVGAVTKLLGGGDRPAHILLEASGVADPTGIATTLLAPVLRGRIRLDAVICVVDAAALDGEHGQQELILRQLMVSDLILLNKADLVGDEGLRRATLRIRGWLSQARIVPTVHGDAPVDVLLSSFRSPVEPDQMRQPPHDCGAGACEHPLHARHADFDTWYYRTQQPLCREALISLARALPGSVYRIKGRVLLEDDPDRPSIVQGVGRRLDIEAGRGRWLHGAESRLLVIGAAGALDVSALQSAFDACRRTADAR